MKRNQEISHVLKNVPPTTTNHQQLCHQQINKLQQLVQETSLTLPLTRIAQERFIII